MPCKASSPNRLIQRAARTSSIQPVCFRSSKQLHHAGSRLNSCKSTHGHLGSPGLGSPDLQQLLLHRRRLHRNRAWSTHRTQRHQWQHSKACYAQAHTCIPCQHSCRHCITTTHQHQAYSHAAHLEAETRHEAAAADGLGGQRGTLCCKQGEEETQHGRWHRRQAAGMQPRE